MLLNPYLYSRPVSGKHFFGREEAVGELRGRIIEAVHPHPCIVVGETRSGRTSLLKTFKNMASERPDLLIHYITMSTEFEKTTSTKVFF